MPGTGSASRGLLAAVWAGKEWVTRPSTKSVEPFGEREVDAFLGFRPEPQEMREHEIGRVILNMTTDKPWSNYFCCMFIGNADFVQKYPVATKRVLRAILKTSDICAAEPEWAARRLVEGAFTPSYDLALQTLTEVPLRQVAGVRPRGLAPLLRVAPPRDGMIKSSPNAILPTLPIGARSMSSSSS